MKIRLAVALLTVSGAASRLYAAPEEDYSLLAFLSARGSERFDSERPVGQPAHGAAIADVLYTYSRSRFRMLAEGAVSTDQAQLDRFQLGCEIVPDTVLWIGKFHEPASAWNFGHDHGHYLETAISTPSIERWSDDAGVLPQNVTGALLDFRQPIGLASFQVSLAAGYSPNPLPRSARPYWVSPLSDGAHQPGWSVRAGFLPDFAGNNDFGLLGAHHQIDANSIAQVGPLSGVSEVDEDVFGSFADGGWRSWSIHAAIYYVDLSLLRPAIRSNESFLAGYAQLERQFAVRPVTAYLRYEDSARAPESSYLRTAQYHFAVRTSLVGLRWDFLHHQALTAELSRTTTFTNQFSRLSLQWSAVVP